MKILKWLPEPAEYPDKTSREILIDDIGWHPMVFDTQRGTRLLIRVEIAKLKRWLWEILTG